MAISTVVPVQNLPMNLPIFFPVINPKSSNGVTIQTSYIQPRVNV